MFQVVTDCMPYPLFESGKMALYQFHQKVVEQEYRPSFEDCFPVNPALKELIQQCWSAKPEDRPSFEEIFNELSSDLTYFIEDVDTNEIRDYISDIKEEDDRPKNHSIAIQTNICDEIKKPEKIEETIKDINENVNTNEVVNIVDTNDDESCSDLID